MAKVLFIVPSAYNPKHVYKEYPLGVGYIATLLKLNGHLVDIYDQNVESKCEEKLFATINRFSPDIIGFSVITPNYPVARKLIKSIKEDFSYPLLIAGGIHANLFPYDLLDDGIDLVVLGEGEYTTLQIANNLNSKQDFESLKGVVFRDRGECITTAVQPRTHHLDDLPIVDRTLYNLELYERHSMLASRGCVFKCKFCCNYTGTILANGVLVREYEKVLEEMKYLVERFDAKDIFFADDIFLAKRSKILAFCNEFINDPIDVSWTGQMRVDLITTEIAEAMKNANCNRIFFGVEAGSEEILKNINKGLSREKIVQGIKHTKEAGIRVKTGWIYGLPGNLDHQYESVELMLKTRPHEISIHQLIPFPGTTYYDRRDFYGIRIKNPKDFESFCYGGLSDNITFDYITQDQLIDLFTYTARLLESEGYVSADEAKPGDEYVYSTPLNSYSIVSALQKVRS